MLDLQPTIGLMLDERAIDMLKRQMRGTVIQPHDMEYEAARRIWNGMIDKYPALIARCADTADVVHAVNFARDNDLLVAVRGGGHSVAGYSTCDGGIVIDLSGMKRVTVDPVARTARAEAGLLLGELDRATQEHGLAVPAGQISHTGIAGLTLGGGTGWLMRKYGLTIDNLLAVEIVTGDGRVLRASEYEHPDLFWAVRGGGGNFGVVTAFEYRLYPVGPQVLAGPIVYTLDKAPEVLRFYREFMPTAPDELTVFTVMLTIPPRAPFPAHLQGQRGLVVDLCYAGPIDEGERVIQPLRSFGTPDLDLVGALPYVVRQSMLDGSAPHGFHHYNKAGYLQDLDDAVIDTLVAHFAQSTSPLASIHLARMGGAIARVADDATAFSDRDALYLFWITGMWNPLDAPERHRAWTRTVATAIKPFTTGGAYVNAVGDEGEAGVRRVYGAAKYARLQALKQIYDPTNLFRLNQNIKPVIE